jgi:dipeptidyl aminopeptidase/acylaminoacyl peptidase
MINTYGHWPSPLSAALLTAQAVRVSEPQACDGRLFWLETRPAEKGRNVLVCQYQGQRFDLLPAPHSIRTRAQEYGGAPWLATRIGVFCVLDVNQRIYFYHLGKQSLTPITPEGAYRYADFCYDAKRQQLLAVREDYTGGNHHPRSEIVAIDLRNGNIRVCASGADFYSNPRLSPDGTQLSYLRWFHPQMPWDNTECICARLNAAGEIVADVIVAGGTQESIFQPQWSPEGELFFVSDRNNWWNIYRWDGTSTHSVCTIEAEIATPQWVFGMSCYSFMTAASIFCCYSQAGRWYLGLIDIASGILSPVQSHLRDISNIFCHEGKAWFIGAGPYHAAQLFECSAQGFSAITQAPSPVGRDCIAMPASISFPTRDGEIAHGFFYSPTNPDITDTPATPPPLLVMAHGGPTGATESSLNLKIQFWTSRGFAVLDVNYRGSTGYGREYRERLKNNWGITDVIDVCSGVDYLVAQGKVDANKVAIRGSSAGGYTVLAALTFSNHFKVGASLYGIGDLEALAKDTHKFEAHYLDSLVGEYPAQQATYRQRSPIHHIDQLHCPVIFLQGLQDKVVPPAQAESMVNALRTKGIKTAYITFEDEGHGFRQAQNIERALNEELAFYQEVFAEMPISDS